MSPHALSAMLAWRPLLPVPLLVALAVLALAVLVAALWRRTAGAMLRAGAALVLLGWLCGPSLLRQSWRDLPETAVLVVDQSASMRIGTRAAVAEAARDKVARAVAALPGVSLRTVTVPEAGHDGTRLFSALDRALADIPAARLAGVIAITDGQVHDVPQALPARMAQVPLHVLVPAESEERDRRLRILEAPPYAIVGQNVTLRIKVDDLGPQGSDTGSGTGSDTARVTLRRDGAAPLVRDVPVGVPQTLTVPVARPGPTLLDLDAAEWPGEISTLNNRQVVQINGVRDRLRVLLISGEPNQGERVWRRLLKADPSVQLVHFTILRPPDKDDMTPLSELALIQFPVRELFQEKIDQFDLIILDQFQNRGILPLAYLQNIADFVRQGGGLLLTAGPEFIGPGSLQDTPLGDILPVHVPETGGLTEQRYRPVLTALGERHPVTAGLSGAVTAGLSGAATAAARAQGDAPWGPWFRLLRADSVKGETLMQGPAEPGGGPAPLLVLDHVEQGRIAMLLSDQIWLWSRAEGGGGPQAELLRRTAHWLMKEPDLDEEQLHATIAGGSLTVIRRSAAASPAEAVTIHAPDGGLQHVQLVQAGPGIARITLPAAARGVWEADDGSRRAFAAAQPDDPVELADLRATATRLEPLLRAQGEAPGSLHWLGRDPAALRVPTLRLVDAHGRASGDDWIGLRRGRARVVTGAETTPLLPGWLMLPLALALLLAGWWRESRR